MGTTMRLDADLLKEGKSILRAVNHNLRQRILAQIHKNGKIIVSELYQILNIEQSVASQHLAYLRAAKLVNTERDGKRIYYSVNYKKLDEIQELGRQMIDVD